MANRRPLSSELTLSSEDGEEAIISNLPVPVMQALYHELTGKRERNERLFGSDYIIRKNSVKDLVLKIEQTLEQFTVISSNLTATIFHYQKDKITCSSLEKFSQYDETRSDKVSSIELKFDFLLTPPNLSKPQNYTINILIRSYILLVSDKIASRGLGSYGRNDTAIDLKIDYVDYVISRTFQSTVEDWVNSLDKVDIFRLPQGVENRRYLLIENLKFSIPAMAIFIASEYLQINNESLTSSITKVVFIYFLIKTPFDDLIETADDLIFTYSIFPFIILNKTDESNFRNFQRRRRKALSLGITLFSGILIGVLGNAVYTALTSYF